MKAQIREEYSLFTRRSVQCGRFMEKNRVKSLPPLHSTLENVNLVGGMEYMKMEVRVLLFFSSCFFPNDHFSTVHLIFSTHCVCPFHVTCLCICSFPTAKYTKGPSHFSPAICPKIWLSRSKSSSPQWPLCLSFS